MAGFELVPLDDSDRAGSGWELTPIEPEKPSVLKTVLLENPGTAILETGANLLSQGVALPAAGLAGIGTAAARAMGLTDKEPADVVHAVGGALTYTPRGEFGKAATAIATAPFEALAKVGQGAGDWILDKTGSPTAATAIDTAINAAPMAVVPALKASRSAAARGLLEHHADPSPAVLQRLLRMPEDQAVATYEAWRQGKAAKEGGQDGASKSPVQGRVQRVGADAATLPEPEQSGFQALRREGDQGLPAVGELQEFPGRYGAEAAPGSVAGATGRERGLRADELPLDGTEISGRQPEGLLQSGTERRTSEYRGGGAAAEDVPQHFPASAVEARNGRTAGAVGPDDAARRANADYLAGQDAEHRRLGAGNRDQPDNAAGTSFPLRDRDGASHEQSGPAQESLARAERILSERGSIAGFIDHYNTNVRDGNTVESFSRHPDGSHTLRVTNGQAARNVTIPADKLPEYLAALRDPAKVAEIEARNAGDVVLGKRVRDLDDAALGRMRGMVSLSDAARAKLEREAKRREVDTAAHQAATSPLNNKPQPTLAQIEAGTYAKGHIDLHGLPISIENPKGSIRRGTDASGRQWETKLENHYGYFKRSAAKDGDHVDVFIGERPESTRAFVIDQIDPKTGKYDEAKVILGALDEADAKRIYHANYEPGWKGMGAITPMEIDALKGWIGSAESKKPVALPKIAGKAITEFDDVALARMANSPTYGEAARAKVQAEIERRTASADFSPDAAQDMAAGVQNGTWNPGAQYQPFVDQVRAPVSAAKTVADLPAPLRRERIIKDLADALDTHVYEGRVKGKNRLGFFRPANREVRIKNAADIEVAAHELAHLLDNKISALSAAWRSDKVLREQLKSVSYDQKSVTEGFAESVRLWATQGDVLEARAPRVFQWLEGFANSHEYGPALRRTQSQMHAWFEQDALNRARSKIGDPDKFGNSPIMQHLGDWWKQQRKEWRQSVSDDLAGLYDAERSLTGKISPTGAYETARLSRGAPAITDGAIRFGAPLRKADGSYTFTGKGLHEILRPVSGRIEDFMLYAVGKSAQELMGQKREHLFSPAEIEAMIKLETPEFRTALNEFQTWNRAIVDYAQAHGVVNAESRAMWNRQIYLPFWRVSQPGEWKGGKVGDWQGVKALTGGTSNIRDVLSNVIGNANLLITKARVNDLMATYDVIRRIEKLEGRVESGKESSTAMLLRMLRDHGYEEIERVFKEEFKASKGRAFEIIMNVMDDTEDPKVFERYRGLVPDEVIRRAYGKRVNWGGDEVRRLAGVIDAKGNVMPGYVMLDNGLINRVASCPLTPPIRILGK